MQRIVLTALALGVGVISATAEPESLDSAPYAPSYTRASLDSRYLSTEEQSQPEQSPGEAAYAVFAQSGPRLEPVRPQSWGRRHPVQRAQPMQQARPVQRERYVQPQEQQEAPRYRTARGQLGGGFIEFLFGGGEARQSARAAPEAALAPPPDEPAPETIEQIYNAPSRVASVPAGRMVQPPPAMDSKFLPTVVDYSGSEQPGTIIINTRERFLYLVQEGGSAKRYGIGVGRPGFTWAGVHKVTAKREWPDWHPPSEMLKRQPYLPVHMAGGPNNPLGARALYLGSTLYRIHGSNEPWTIGHAVSSGCIRMRNQDVIDLYDRVGVGAKVVVI
jgi:lipoprotein-anchoring transpeptidase ErfK/SrfK